MGLAKEEMLRQQERYCSSIDGDVCADCFSDPTLRLYVEANAGAHLCSFCGREAKEPIAVTADEVVDVIMEGILYEWAGPEQEIPHESAEGGFLWPGIDFDEVLEQLGHPIAGLDFLEAMRSATCDHTYEWYKRDYLAPHLNEAMASDWKRLVERVKFSSRYLFALDDDKQSPPEPSRSAGALKILEEMASRADDVGLIRALPAKRGFWRARPHEAEEHFELAADLGTLSADKSLWSNRMSPAGIPAFYGAESQKTAVAEVTGTTDPRKSRWSAGLFETTRDCVILDLVDLGELPSSFDPEQRHLQRPLMFFQAFAEEISQPLKKPGREQLDYVPAQIVSEFMRSFESSRGRVDGIRYRSAQHEGGVCIALFVPHERCVDESTGEDLELLITDHDHGEIPAPTPTRRPEQASNLRPTP